MNASFGIDHPLLATRDIEKLRNYLIALGFNMTAVGKHPWGTSTSLAMFDGCLLEIMGMYDDSLIDEVPAGEFRFGRHVFEHLQLREGVALSALHSTDSVADAQRAEEAGFSLAGHLEFGRVVTLPDGAADRTKTTLALLPDAKYPRLSLFLCQQHRPELIYVPEWLEHPNKVNGICGVNIIASQSDLEDLQLRFTGLYGKADKIQGGMSFQTANGVIRVLLADAFQSTYGAVPEAVLKEQSPCIAGMDFRMPDPDTLLGFLDNANQAYKTIGDNVVLSTPEHTANTILSFCATENT